MAYQWISAGEQVTVQWTAGGLQGVARGLGVGLAGIGLWLPWGLRAKAGAGLRTAASGFFLAAGIWFMIAGFGRGAVQRWVIDGGGVRVEAGGRDVFMAWPDLLSVRLDRGFGSVEKASLVLQDARGQRTWLTAGWLIRAHRRELVDILARRAPQAMAPVLADKAYVNALKKGS